VERIFRNRVGCVVWVDAGGQHADQSFDWRVQRVASLNNICVYGHVRVEKPDFIVHIGKQTADFGS
jgi:hypothetical protein